MGLEVTDKMWGEGVSYALSATIAIFINHGYGIRLPTWLRVGRWGQIIERQGACVCPTHPFPLLSVRTCHSGGGGTGVGYLWRFRSPFIGSAAHDHDGYSIGSLKR